MTCFLVLFDPTITKPTSQPLSWEKPGKIRDPPVGWFPTFYWFLIMKASLNVLIDTAQITPGPSQNIDYIIKQKAHI